MLCHKNVVFVACSIIPKCLFWLNNPCNAAHLHFFSRYLYAGKFFLMQGDCYYRLPDKILISLVVESVTI